MRKICLRCGSKFGGQAVYCPHDGTVLATDEAIPDSLIGHVLLEQFRIDALIGTGGMGTVYRARQTTIDRDVAVKVLRLELARDENAVLRFEREAQLAASLDHPNLVRVLLSGRLSDGRLYFVMELLEGRSLADELDAHGIPGVERALVMTMKLCAGLGAVHARGIVHRDIKPENIYLVTRGGDTDFVKLVDFGISRALDGEVPQGESQTGRVFGTAAYISPEAATGEPTDLRSDIYSVGVLMYLLLTGELPFEGKTAGALLMQHVHEEPPPMSSRGAGVEVPSAVERVVMRALAKDPNDRFQHLAELVDALAQAAVEAGLLTNARGLLLGTVWGDELAAPGSFLSELLGASSIPVNAETLRLAPELDAYEDDFLSSAPKPFGTSSLEMRELSAPRRRRQGWLWASLGTLAVLLLGIVAGTLWLQRTPSATATDEAAGSEAPIPTKPLVDVATRSAPPVVVEESTERLEEPEEAEVALVGEEVGRAPEAKPKRRRKRKPAAAPSSTRAMESVPAPGEAPAPGSTPATGSAPAERDDGIDWTVPGFPEGELGKRAEPDPTKPAPPTGTPDAPPRNPVVIDEVPSDDVGGGHAGD